MTSEVPESDFSVLPAGVYLLENCCAVQTFMNECLARCLRPRTGLYLARVRTGLGFFARSLVWGC